MSCAAPTASGVLTTLHCCRPNFSSALVTYSSWSSVMVRAFRSRVMRMPSIHVAVCSCLMLKRSCSSFTLSLELRRVLCVVAALHVVDEAVDQHQSATAAALEVQRRVADRRLECPSRS